MKTSYAASLILDQYLTWEKEFNSSQAYTFILGYTAGMVGGGGLTIDQYGKIAKGTGRLTPNQFKKHLENLSNEE